MSLRDDCCDMGIAEPCDRHDDAERFSIIHCATHLEVAVWNPLGDMVPDLPH
jgi:hypothetical protein